MIGSYIGHSVSDLAADLSGLRVLEIPYRRLPTDARGRVGPGDPSRPVPLPARCLLSMVSIYTETTTATETQDCAIRWWITADRAGRVVLTPATVAPFVSGPTGLGGVAAALEVAHARIEGSEGIYVWIESGSDVDPEGTFRARVWWRVLAPEDVSPELCELIAERLQGL